ncbi:MAG: nucleotidyltransferase domain-containing protein [Ectothiorhodospiraceae bacterium]|nr:nucleotidyltransferase domain-containing protein [Ectothiorhodospiraceae bacterium]
MRLSTRTQKIIRDTSQEIFGSEATVTLFGSRVDDFARGGDIDLLIQSEAPIAQRGRKALTLVARLQIRLGDQPIDVLVLDPKTTRQPVNEEALRVGVKL